MPVSGERVFTDPPVGQAWLPLRRPAPAAPVEFCERYWPREEPDDDVLEVLALEAAGAAGQTSKRCDTCYHLTADGRCGWRSVPLLRGWPVERLGGPRSC